MLTEGDAPPSPRSTAEEGERTVQELVDYLVVATAEEDVLYVVYWLRQLKERGLLWKTGERCSAIETKHSWRKQSALETLTSQPRSDIRQFILFLFLFNLETVDPKGKVTLDVEVEQMWAKKIVEKWAYKWRAASLDALDVLRKSTDEEDADWVDANFPLSPDSDDLFTGCGPLPAPPFSAVKHEASPESLNADPTQHRISPAPAALPVTNSPLPSSLAPRSPTPALPPLATPALPLPLSPSPAPLSNPHAPSPPPRLQSPPLLRKTLSDHLPLASSAGLGRDHVIRLNIFGLHPDTTRDDITQLFHGINVRIREFEIRHYRYVGAGAFVTVRTRADWERADRLLPEQTVRGRRPRVERLHPLVSQRGRPEHPTVVVDGFVPGSSLSDIEDVIRKTRCGAYGVEVSRDGRQGRARASSPDTADRMVRMLEGLEDRRGSRVSASWIDGEGRRHTVREKEDDGEEEEGEVKAQGHPIPSASRLVEYPPSGWSSTLHTSQLPPSSSPTAPRSRHRPNYPWPESSPFPPASQKRRRLSSPPTTTVSSSDYHLDGHVHDFEAPHHAGGPALLRQKTAGPLPTPPPPLPVLAAENLIHATTGTEITTASRLLRQMSGIRRWQTPVGALARLPLVRRTDHCATALAHSRAMSGALVKSADTLHAKKIKAVEGEESASDEANPLLSSTAHSPEVILISMASTMCNQDWATYVYLRSLHYSTISTAQSINMVFFGIVVWPLFGIDVVATYASLVMATYAVFFWSSALTSAYGVAYSTYPVNIGGFDTGFRLILHGVFVFSCFTTNFLAMVSAWYKNHFLQSIGVVVKLRTIICSKHPLPFRLRRLQYVESFPIREIAEVLPDSRTYTQSNLDELVKRLIPRVGQYGDGKPLYLVEGDVGAGPPTLIFEKEGDKNTFQSLLEGTARQWAKIAWPGQSRAASLPTCAQQPFRLSLYRYVRKTCQSRPSGGASLHLYEVGDSLLLDHLDIAFARSFHPPMSAAMYCSMQKGPLCHFVTFAHYVHSNGLLAIALANSLLRGLESVAFPTLSFTFPGMYSDIGLLLHDPSLFAQHLLGIGYPPFNPKTDRIATEHETFTNPDISAFLVSFNTLLDLVKRLAISQKDFLDHWDHAFDEQRKEIDLALLEHDVCDLVLDAVIAWKEVKREQEDEAAKKKQA
ncbi:hypothetical protein JCM11251_006621 [Rhodosporidiobolus azoricus]